MRLLNRKTNIDFFGKRKIAFTLSALLIVISIASLTLRGLNFGLDFTGGALIEVAYSVAPDLEQVRDNLEAAGLDDAVVQTFGLDTEIVVRIPPRSEEESSADLSTLVLQALTKLSGAGRKVLYVSGEESARQIRMRAERLGPLPENVLILAETSLEQIDAHISECSPDVIVIDSVQTVYSADLESAPGSVSCMPPSSTARRRPSVCGAPY